MIRLAIFAVTVALVAKSHATETKVLTSTFSPDKRTVIAVEQSKNGDHDYCFLQKSSGKKLGFVLPAEQRHEISKVHFVTSWNRSGSKVALLVFYGTKFSELLLNSKDATGQFHLVACEVPDAAAVYQQRTNITVPQPGDGYSHNAVGPWLDENTVSARIG